MSKCAIQTSKNDENSKLLKKDDRVNTYNKPLMRSQLSVRRNTRKIYKEWDIDGVTPHTQDKPKVIMTCVQNDQGGNDSHSNKFADPSMVDFASCSSSNQQPEKSNVKVDNSKRGNDNEDRIREDKNKDMECDKHDNKNLMDLGDSEIERNIRLENLIAKRRAMKLFKTQIEKVIQLGGNVPQSQIAPIFIAKTINPSGIRINCNNNTDNLDMPSSAPSILLPSRNPFDLPYEPHEEKPNLMADSFQQEFTAADHEKEMLFCRHESFSRGSFEQKRAFQDFMFGPHFAEQSPNTIFMRQSNLREDDKTCETSSHEIEPINIDVGLENKEENQIDAVKPKHKEDVNINNPVIDAEREQSENSLDTKSNLDNAVEIEINSVKDNISESSSPSSVEGRGLIYNEEKKTFSENLQRRRGVFPPLLHNRVKASPTPFDNEHFYYSNPIGHHKKSKMEERSFYTNKKGSHARTFSIASDMQVEASEVSSPPAIIDEVPSSPDRDSLTYDGDIEKGQSSGDEDMWTSFNARSTIANDALQEAIVGEDVLRFLQDTSNHHTKGEDVATLIEHEDNPSVYSMEMSENEALIQTKQES
ncbi:hypothetical protein ACFE04_012601 [Oxalis oulophora]